MTIRRLLIALSCTALLGGAAAFLTGAVGLVETHGNSMAPRINAADLVLVHASNTYRVGDVVAYTSPELGQVVLHRVVSIHDNGTYTLRGDHNTFDDPEQPTEQQFIGKELLHVPAGGIWIDRLTSPIALGILAFAVLAAGGTAANARPRSTKRTKRTPMAQHAATTRSARTASSWPARWRTIVAVAAATLCIGLALGVMSWTRPTASIATNADPTARTVTFAYRADVPPSPAYDDTRVSAPDPIFRRLTDKVNIRYTYRGEPGTVSVAGELSTPSGWHSTVPLQPPVTFNEPEHAATVPVDLDRLERHAHAAADAIGIPATQIDIAIVPTITTEDGGTFEPELRFALTPLQLSLVGGPSTLEAVDPTTTQSPDPAQSAQGTFALAGYEVRVASVRTASVALIVGSLALLCLVGLISTRRTASEGAAIKRRYASILLPVEPMTSPPGRPIVDVTDFAALAKLSERYGLMVMYWNRANVDTFTVHDDGITYRYRTSNGTGTGNDVECAIATAATAAHHSGPLRTGI
jgi:signal peptidase I